MSHLQDVLLFQMLQQRGSKNEEQENEDQDQPEDVQEEEQEESQKRLIGHYQQVQEPPNYGSFNGKMLITHIAKSSRKSCYSVSSSSSHLASEQAEINKARYGKKVKVQGGHIVRSTARTERHNKVYTSKGPRDRRFRLSAPTAIQFYDVQDRLGYDQPSKAIDWLIEKSKAAIEALSESEPPGKEYGCTNINNSAQQTEQDIGEENMYQFQHHQRSYGEPEKLNNVNSFKEPVLDPHQLSPMNYAEEALNSTSSLSDSKVMEMGWFQSLMAWKYKAGDGGDGCPFNSSHVYCNSHIS